MQTTWRGDTVQAIWRKEDLAATEAFCRLHRHESGESLDPAKCSLSTADSPYPHYRVARIELEPQIVKRPAGNATLSAHHMAYALLRTDDSDQGFTIVPIWQTTSSSAHNIFEVNKLLDFKVTNDSVLPYMMFFGRAVWHPPFQFFQHLDELSALTVSLPEAERERVATTVLGLFPATTAGALKIDRKIEHHVVLGDSYTFELPCFYQGRLYVAKCRVSHEGMPYMLEDRPLEVEGLFEAKDDLRIYPLDASPALLGRFQAIKREREQVRTVILTVLSVDTFLQLWLLPLFMFHIVVTFLVGRNSLEVFNYFERLKQSSLLNICALVFGFAGTCVSLFRYVFLEILALLRKRVPSIWTYTADGMEAEFGKAMRAGKARFAALLALEHFTKTLMSLTLLLLGVSAISALRLAPLNFGQALVAIGCNIPIIGSAVEWVFRGTPFESVVLPTPESVAIATTVTFLFATIAVGVVRRVLATAAGVQKNQ
jgi:hypothetical protein